MDNPVAAVLFDDEGKENIKEILAGVIETEFNREGLRRLLEDPEEVEDWRVGEAIAETYLTDHRSCSFPWPDARDERRSRSSLPGADLVGFGVDDDGACFAFGEVKTSSERRHPPGVMYGRMGLKQQLEDLRDVEATRDDLMKYLGYRSGSAPWKTQYEHAAGRYLRNSSDIQLYGCLVRDVEPHEDDLRARVSDLGNGCPEGTRIELLAIYLPQDRLDGIGQEMLIQRAGLER
ncbi:hypothetical protein [Candidatus Poriferisocius sp.]|uniref:hypothetical protein n=1 Tax=Candidatus Poriferisocius sp. TaxID=3101276 RepID=UPI003B01D17B